MSIDGFPNRRFLKLLGIGLGMGDSEDFYKCSKMSRREGRRAGRKPGDGSYGVESESRDFE